MGLKEKEAPIVKGFNDCNRLYNTLFDFRELIKPVFTKLADGTSNSGKPKSPIEYSQHPQYHASNDSREKLLSQVRVDGGKERSNLMCWDHPDFLGPGGLINHPWFMEQPQFKSLFDQASEINKGKLFKMNKNGKAEVAKEIIGAKAGVDERFEMAESCYQAIQRKKLDEIQAQLNKVVQEEKLAPAGGGGCCVV